VIDPLEKATLADVVISDEPVTPFKKPNKKKKGAPDPKIPIFVRD